MRNDTVIKLLEGLRREAEEQAVKQLLTADEYGSILEHVAAIEEIFAD